jgi:6-phosphofructokinase 1
MKKNVIIAQSGGPTGTINATLAGAIGEAMRSEQIGRVYGGVGGIAGILSGDVIRLDNQIKGEGDLRLLAATPSAALGSCRYKLPCCEDSPEVFQTITERLLGLDVGYFLYIGGNDSMDTVAGLSRYFAQHGVDIRVVGLPKTIDNDIACTDHTPGFGSAAKYVCTSVAEIWRDTVVYGKPTVNIVEIMGRDAGWLTASSGLVRTTGARAPQVILIPERPFEAPRFLAQVQDALKRDFGVVVAVSEGVRFADGQYLSACESAVDAFGHVQLAGAGNALKRLVQDNFGCASRVIELSILQRAAAHCASETDVRESVRVGEQGAALAFSGHTGVMAAIRRISEEPYESVIEPVDVHRVANAVRVFPPEWLDADTSELSGEALAYFLPLIAGNAVCPSKNGLPLHFVFDKTCR